MIMKVPPEKPHFFKPILPGGFTDAIEIPAPFFKYLAGKTGQSDHALLRKGDKEWRVKINGQFLRQGWTKFSTENNLTPGDIVVFEHEGNMAFKVLIFDLSQCEKEEESGNGNSRSRSRNPHFVSTFKPYSLRWSMLNVPIEFARSNGLANRRSEIILKDERERSWHLDLNPNGGTSALRIRRGAIFSEFFAANGFKEGDSFKFELAGNGDTPVARILPYNFADEEPERKSDRGKRAKKPTRQETELQSLNRCPCFTSTILPFNIKKTALNMPMKFARLNGLLKKEKMIIVDEKERSWPVVLKLIGRCHFRIQNGWRKFCQENGIKEGDSYKFELIENGRVPVARFTVIAGGSVQPGSKRRRRASSNSRILS